MQNIRQLHLAVNDDGLYKRSSGSHIGVDVLRPRHLNCKTAFISGDDNTLVSRREHSLQDVAIGSCQNRFKRSKNTSDF